ncbi:MAG TPA: PTS fructose IIA subunit [Erysipelotrichaceae bacterium]|nr:PTS fructose IIA subunit [Erysipelotrichaceae bacterium]
MKLKEPLEVIMRKILIVSHDNLAQGMFNFLNMILGKQKNIDFINAYVDDITLEEKVNSYMDNNKNCEIIVVTDLYGGSVNNYFMENIDKYHLITGMNAVMLLTLSIKLDSNETTESIIEEAITSAKEGIIYCNKIQLDSNEDDF